VRHDEVANPLLKVVKNANRHCLEEVGHRKDTHEKGNISKHVESSVGMAQREFGIGCFIVGITER
jgi:hypothetical protein